VTFRITSLRPARFDELGLRRALSDWTVPFFVAAMAFLAGLAVAGFIGAAVLTEHWEGGAGSTLTVQIPGPSDPAAGGSVSRVNSVLLLLRATPGVSSARIISDVELNVLLAPWLGADLRNLAVPLPGVIAVRLSGESMDAVGLAAKLTHSAPGTIVDDHAIWSVRLGRLAHSLRLVIGTVLLIVAILTAAVIAVMMRSVLEGRREAIMIVHQLGATDSYIAQKFATRSAALAAFGGVIGGLLALPAISAMTSIAAAPLAGEVHSLTDADTLSTSLLVLPPSLTLAAAAIGYVTVQLTMRQWLRQLS